MWPVRSALVAVVILASLLVTAGATAVGLPARQDAPAAGRASVEFTVVPRTDPAVGDLITWDYTIYNHTSFALENIVITDELEGQVCYIDVLGADTSRTCFVVTLAGASGYEATANVVGTSVAADGAVIREIEAELTRVYEVHENPNAPEDLAFTDERPGDRADPSWPIDRWAPWAVVSVIAAGVLLAAFRLQPEPEKARSSTTRR